MRLGPLADDKVKDINYNDPQHIYTTLKQEFEPDTASNRVAKVGEVSNMAQVAQVCKGKWQKDEVRNYPCKASVLYRQEL